MKYRALVTTTLLALSAVAHAQRPVTLTLGGGASFPLGRLGDVANTGWHALAGIGLSSLMQPIGLRLDVAYNQFGGKSNAPDQNIGSATLNVTYRLPMTRSAFSPYVIAGGGPYRLDCDDDSICESEMYFGWNAGVGTKFNLFGLKGILESRFNAVNSDEGNARYIPLTLGLTF